MADKILALDQGTTSSRALVIGPDGAILAVSQKEFPQHFPQSGWVEHDPEEIWRTQKQVAKSALRKSGVDARDIAAIGITNQRETTVAWDRATGKPIHRAIVWQDRRTADFCNKLKRGKRAEEFTRRTGLIVDPYFAGTKIRWILDNVPDAREMARSGQLAVGTIDSWLIWNLTGGKSSAGAKHLTDATNAARTLLCDIHDIAWAPELARSLKVPLSLLPEIVPSSGVCAEAHKSVFGFPIPIAGIAGDQHAALFGQVCTKPGMVKNTYGTGCFLLMNTGRKPRPSKCKLLTTPSWQIGKKTDYALEGSIFVGGAVVQWLRDGLQIIKRAKDVEALSNSVDDNGGVYVVPAFAGLGAPHWDPYARGTIVGLTRGSSRGHIARAALESIAYQTADVVDAMRKDSGIRVKSLRVDGGAAMNDALMQFQADILGVPVVRPRTFESTAMGAGYLAGLACGVWKSVAELDDMWEIDRVFEPAMETKHASQLRGEWNRAIERSKAWEQ